MTLGAKTRAAPHNSAETCGLRNLGKLGPLPSLSRPPPSTCPLTFHLCPSPTRRSAELPTTLRPTNQRGRPPSSRRPLKHRSSPHRASQRQIAPYHRRKPPSRRLYWFFTPQSGDGIPLRQPDGNSSQKTTLEVSACRRFAPRAAPPFARITSPKRPRRVSLVYIHPRVAAVKAGESHQANIISPPCSSSAISFSYSV